MLIYGKQKEYTLNNFIIKRFQSCNKYWKHRLFPDHLSRKDYILLAKSILKNEKIIFMSLESSRHSIRYLRMGNFDFQISYKANKSFYYNILVNEYLSGHFTKINQKVQIKEKIAFVVSNYQKLNQFMNQKNIDFDLIDLYGIYGSPVPIFEQNHEDDMRPLWSKEVQALYSQYIASICIENSFVKGYHQGSYIPALFSGSVPIIKADKSIHKVLKPECYINFSEYINLPNNELFKTINKKSKFINSKNIEDFFTPLFHDYLSFLKNVDLNEITNAIKISQEFREEFFN